MATPIIQTTGSVSGVGTADEGRNDLAAAETVTFSDLEPLNAAASYVWTLDDRPFGSAAALVDSGTSTPDLVVDVVGSYRVSVLVDGSDTGVIIVSVPLATTGARIPSTGETTEYNEGGNTEGWAQAWDAFARAVDAALTTVVGAHSVAAPEHTADTAANFNAKITDANFDDAGDPRTPTSHAASHADGGPDEIDVAGLGSGAAVAGKVLETDGAGGLILIDTPSGGGGNAAVANEPWAIPAVAHAEDIEFDGSVLDPSLTLNFTPAGTVDSYNTDTTASECAVAYNDPKWPGCMVLQPRANGNIFRVRKDITFATNTWMELRFGLHNMISSGGDGSFDIALHMLAAGSTSTDYAGIFLRSLTPGSQRLSVIHKEGGVSEITDIYDWAKGDNNDGLEYFALHKVGTNIHYYMAAANRHWIYLATTDRAAFAPIDGVAFDCKSSGVNVETRGNPLFLMKHWRFQDIGSVPL